MLSCFKLKAENDGKFDILSKLKQEAMYRKIGFHAYI